MKRLAALFLMLCLLPFSMLSGAEEAAFRYEYDGFEAVLPENWYFGFSEGGSAYYYGNPEGTMDDGMIMFLVEKSDSLTGVTLTDEYYTLMFDDLLQDATAGADGGLIGSEESMMAGKRSLVYWCRTAIDDSGVLYSLAANMTIAGGGLFAIMVVHPSAELAALKETALRIGATVQYAGDTEEAAAAEAAPEETGENPAVSVDLPTADNPYYFSPNITGNQNLLLAQWMIDDGSRAMCSMLLSLDMSISYGSLDLPYPMDLFASYIGSADDIILAFVPSQDRTLAFVFQYDTVNQAAFYYSEPLSDEAQAAFEAACTDQFYPLTEDALNYAVQLLQEAFANPQ